MKLYDKNTKWYLLGIIAFFAIVGRFSPDPTTVQLTPEKLAEENMLSAKYICKEFTQKSLHDPKSSEFEGYPNHYFGELKKEEYHIQVPYRAKNGFNAMRSSMADCKVIISEKEVNGTAKRWALVSLKSWNQ